MSSSFWPHAPQHTRLLCPPLSSRVCSDSSPLSRWCYLNISSSGTPFSFCLQFPPTSESFPMSQPLALLGQSNGASDSASVLPMNIQGQFHLGLIDWFDHFSVQESQESSSAPQFKSIISSLCKLFYGPTFTSGKTIALTLQNFVDKVMPLLFNTLWHSFVSRSKCLLISWL